jgi:hypothetical protein
MDTHMHADTTNPLASQAQMDWIGQVPLVFLIWGYEDEFRVVGGS